MLEDKTAQIKDALVQQEVFKLDPKSQDGKIYIIISDHNSPVNQSRFGTEFTPEIGNQPATLTTIDPNKYMEEVAQQYSSRGMTLPPEIRDSIWSHISVEGRVFSRADGLPGLHAEVVAMNAIYNEARERGIWLVQADVATVRPTTGAPFLACTNCNPILSGLDQDVTILIGVVDNPLE